MPKRGPEFGMDGMIRDMTNITLARGDITEQAVDTIGDPGR